MEDKFVRWQTVLREQITFLNNLLLTFAIAIVGFFIDLLAGSTTFTVVGCQKIFFTLGLLLIILSALTGLVTAFSRLLDFRTTTRKIREDQTLQIDTEELKMLAKLYGSTTWVFFYLQIGTFFLGTINLMTAVIWINSEKLF